MSVFRCSVFPVSSVSRSDIEAVEVTAEMSLVEGFQVSILSSGHIQLELGSRCQVSVAFPWKMESSGLPPPAAISKVRR